MDHSPLSRRSFLRTAGGGAVMLTLSAHGLTCRPTSRRPNILFIMSDDHGYQAMSCYGGGLNQTPNLDRIAAEGMRFEQSFCTNSICAPSRATLLTGQYNHLNGQITNAERFDGSQLTFPKLLQTAGYQTAIIGKWHLKSDPTGFDYWNIVPDQGDYYNPDFIEMGERKRLPGYVTDLTTDLGLEWLKNRHADKSFCLLLHYKAPHRNWMPGPEHLSLYRDEDIPAPQTLFDDYSSRSAAAREQEMTLARHLWPAYDLKLDVKPDTFSTRQSQRDFDSWQSCYDRMDAAQQAAWDAAYRVENEAYAKAGLTGDDLTRWRYQRYIKDYLRCIASIDDNVGRILNFLDRHGLAEDTILVYTSDQGFYLGEHGWFDKRFMYEESLRMPLLIRYPREIASTVNSQDMVMNLDFAPTFLDYAGVTVPEQMQGRSIRRILKGDTPEDWRQSIYYHYFEYPGWHMVKRHYGIRTQQYKLIHFYYDIDAWELYDLRKDPHELRNIYDDPAYADILAKLKTELDKLRVYYKDTDKRRFLPKQQ